ncbi:hypothetical protein ND748_28450, partial [Frankia sp. AiPs1]
MANLGMALGSMAVSAAALVVEILMIISGSVGVVGQVSGSGGGYAGLFGALGPVLAAAATVVLYRTAARHRRRRRPARAAPAHAAVHRLPRRGAGDVPDGGDRRRATAGPGRLGPARTRRGG